VASGAYVWHRTHLSQSGSLPVPWEGAPNNVVTIGEVADPALAGATLKRVIFAAWAHINVDGAQDPPLPDWQSRTNWFFTIGHSFTAGDPAPDPVNFGESVTIGSGQLRTVAWNPWNATDLIWVKHETYGDINFESQRAAPDSFSIPYLQVGAQSSAYDTLSDPLTDVTGSWTFDCWIRALYQSL
jgi:hypothetical protein